MKIRKPWDRFATCPCASQRLGLLSLHMIKRTTRVPDTLQTCPMPRTVDVL